MSTVYRTRPDFFFSDATACILKHFEVRFNIRDYAFIIGIDPVEGSHRELQVVVKKVSAIKKATKFKTLFRGDSEAELKAALSSRKVQGLITPVNGLPKNITSVAQGKQEMGKARGEFEVISVPDNKIPCRGIALRKVARPEALFRLRKNSRINPEVSQVLLSSIGNFPGIYHITFDNLPKVSSNPKTK